MAQVTWRAPDELVDRLRDAARWQRRSLSDFITQLAMAVTDPDMAGDDVQQLCERLARAGLLSDQTSSPRPRPDAEAAAAARTRAATGQPLSDIIVQSRG